MKKEIYILEDDEDIREMLQYVMESEGYLVLAFASIGSLREQLKLNSPDLLLLDIWLPDGDGRKLCLELRLQKETLNLPIVMMTANSTIHRVEGASDFIPKPFDITDLMTRVERLLAAA